MATVDILVVAGGGGTARWGNYSSSAGGGGAGGLINITGYTLEPNSYSVSIGAGGTYGYHLGTTGGDTTFGSLLTAKGGGYGASGSSNNAGGDGGSGGGGCNDLAGGSEIQTTQSGDSGTYGAGYDGVGPFIFCGGSGAGGAGAGTNTDPGNPGVAGGDGVTVWGYEYSRGGRAGMNKNDFPTVQYGWGASSSDDPDGFGQTAGAGIVKVRYLIGTVDATGGTETDDGTYTYHTFTSNGTFEISSAATENTIFLSNNF